MANLTSYTFHSNKIRTLTVENGEIIFCLADVCKTLDLGQGNKTANQIKEEFGCTELNSAHLVDALGRDQEATFITEPQLYFVMMRSRAKVAREFRQWIVNEVLPSIRKTGTYTIKQPNTKPATSDCKKWIFNELNKVFKDPEFDTTLKQFRACMEIADRAWRQGYAVAKSQDAKGDIKSEVILDKTAMAERRKLLRAYIFNHVAISLSDERRNDLKEQILFKVDNDDIVESANQIVDLIERYGNMYSKMTARFLFEDILDYVMPFDFKIEPVRSCYIA